MVKTEKYILVGKLGRTRGIQGQLWITPLTDFPERFVDLKEIYVGGRDSWELFKIEEAQLMSGRPLIKFAGIASREEAARLTNRGLAVLSDQLMDLPRDMFYVFDLIGCEVIESETNKNLGEIIDVRRYPANDVYVIKTKAGKEVLYPAVTDFVVEVDIDHKKVVVKDSSLFDLTDERTER